jgi:hypothetical protein
MAKKKKQSGRTFVIVTVVVSLVVLPILFMLLSAWGEKSGVEFSPDDFSMRSFDYCRLPLIGWTRRGIKYKDVDNATAKMLIDDDWIRATGRNQKRWHLVSESIPALISQNKIPAACDARFLTEYFDLSNKDGIVLVTHWTDENPDSAKLFWPMVAEMARDSLYLPMPELMQFVLNYPTPDKDESFETKLTLRVGDIWYQAAITDQLKGQHERAISRFDMAIAKNPDHADAAEAKKLSQQKSP